MRFKAKAAYDQVSTLTNILQIFGRLSDTSVMKLTPEKIFLSTRAPPTSQYDGVHLYSELSCNALFLNHRIESVADNSIVFELDLNHLRVALQTILSSRKQQMGGGESSSLDSAVVIIKLAKRNGISCLCLESSDNNADDNNNNNNNNNNSTASSSSSIKVSHDLPVHIMKVADFSTSWAPPVVGSPLAQLYLPHQRPIRLTVERLKNMAKSIYVTGDMNNTSSETNSGSLELHVFGEGASVNTIFSEMQPEFENCLVLDKENSSVKKNRCKVKIESKKLNEVFKWQSHLMMGRNVSHALISLLKDEMLILHAMLDPVEVGYFTYYCPVQFLDAEDEEYDEEDKEGQCNGNGNGYDSD